MAVSVCRAIATIDRRGVPGAQVLVRMWFPMGELWDMGQGGKGHAYPLMVVVRIKMAYVKLLINIWHLADAQEMIILVDQTLRS